MKFGFCFIRWFEVPPNDFSDSTWAHCYLCWFDEAHDEDQLQDVEQSHQKVECVPELSMDAQRGLQWLKHLVLVPKLWSVQDDLWHPDFFQNRVCIGL